MDTFMLCAIISSGWSIVASMTIDGKFRIKKKRVLLSKELQNLKI